MRHRRIYLIRHGQTAWNMEGRWQGHEDTELSPDGIEQAKALAAHWTQPLDAIYSSHLRRAWRTATILGEAVNLTPKADERLREFHVGVFQGLTMEEAALRYPEEYRAIRADNMGYRIPGGESRSELQARIHAAILDILSKDPAENIAFVSHGGALKVLLYKFFPDQIEHIRAGRIENTSVSTLETDGHTWRLVKLTDASHLAHLPDMQSKSSL